MKAGSVCIFIALVLLCILLAPSFAYNKITFTEDADVSGFGYVNVKKVFQTRPGDLEKNRVTEFVQHGAGSYESAEAVTYKGRKSGSTTSDSIEFSEDSILESAPVSLGGLVLNSKWKDCLRTKNYRLKSSGGWIGAVLRECYRDAAYLEKSSSSYVGYYNSTLTACSEVNGTAQVDALVKDYYTGETIAKLSEFYMGNFTIEEDMEVTRPEPTPKPVSEKVWLPCPWGEPFKKIKVGP
jgi:hypothetical protein